MTEHIYSTGMYKIIGNLLSPFSKITKISVGEFLLYILLLFILFQCLRFVYHLFQPRSNVKKMFFTLFINIIVCLSILYFVFIITWGINYHRLPFSTIANLNPQPSSVEDLESLCENLIEQANSLREKNLEDEQGLTDIPNKLKSVPERSNLGFSISSRVYPELGGRDVYPKGVFLSNLMSYAGIAGIFFPFTGEANFNTLLPDVQLPSTVTHEIAHQRGFAREDEANYIAYLVCSHHPDVDFQYSGILLALSHSMNKLYEYDQDKYLHLTKNYSKGLIRDLDSIKEFWSSYEGPLERFSSKMNNLYLKSNLQEEGVHSYGRMVDLLLAEFKEGRKTSMK
ncbi:DUF3810 domain-containing protein [Irregularibacter muris]|uniref:DUF3810 domain-containing protein n=2 Tax=Irregularibacter muris TaxID=1796619 RepID=A0AAE3HFI8_9FIRM|nr:DUF3810 domain-containing protein [Irregularibacter muris]